MTGSCVLDSVGGRRAFTTTAHGTVVVRGGPRRIVLGRVEMQVRMATVGYGWGGVCTVARSRTPTVCSAPHACGAEQRRAPWPNPSVVDRGPLFQQFWDTARPTGQPSGHASGREPRVQWVVLQALRVRHPRIVVEAGGPPMCGGRGVGGIPTRVGGVDAAQEPSGRRSCHGQDSPFGGNGLTCPLSN